jgi:hypothetical protein
VIAIVVTKLLAVTDRSWMDGQADKVDRINMHRVVRRISRAKITGTHIGERVIRGDRSMDIGSPGVRRGRHLTESRVDHTTWPSRDVASFRQGLDNSYQQRAKS